MRKGINGSLSSALILSGILSGWTRAQSGDVQPAAKPAVTVPDRKERFIAAVDWAVERTPEFVWPFEPMPAAPYESVRMVVESMPWVIAIDRKGVSEPLNASRHLRINGRLQKPVRVIRQTSTEPEQQEFLIKLDRGRLRLRLIPPAGTVFDRSHAVVKVKLYEV